MQTSLDLARFKLVKYRPNLIFDAQVIDFYLIPNFVRLQETSYNEETGNYLPILTPILLINTFTVILL